MSFCTETCTIEHWRPVIEVNNGRYSFIDASIQVESEKPLQFRLVFQDTGIEWNIRVEQDEAENTFLISSTIRNTSQNPAHLGKVNLLTTDATVKIGTGQDHLVCLSLSGECSAREIFSLSDANCPRESKIKTQFFNRRDRCALQIGFITFQRANTEVHHTFDPDVGVSSLEAWCDFAGWVLPPGDSTETEVCIIASGVSPYAQLERWADLAAGRCNPRRWEDPPIGWLGKAWVDPYAVEPYESTVVRNAKAIREQLAGFGVRYVYISLGTLADCTPGRWLDWNYELFPSGRHYLARLLEEHGLKWGLWCGAFWMCPLATEQMERMNDALLRDPDGTPIVMRDEWQYGKAGEMEKSHRPPMYALDPSHPETHRFLHETFETFRRWGIRYYMIDFLRDAAGNISSHPYTSHHDKTLVAGPEAYHAGLSVIRKAAGDDTFLLSSSGPTIHNAGFADAARTGNDFGEGRPLYPDSYFYPATFVINSETFWTGAGRALQNQGAAYYTHRRLYQNNSGNVLTVDKPIPLSAARIHATIHAMSGGQTMMGDDIERIDEERLGLIKKTLPRPKDVAFPVNLFDSVAPDYQKVFHRKVSIPWGTYDVVAVYNFSEDSLRQEIAFADLKSSPVAKYLVWEFWNGEYHGRAAGSFSAHIPPKNVRVYRFVEDSGIPVILGTDMHILMGEMEIDRSEWNAATMSLGGRAIRPAGERGSVFVHAPETMRVENPDGFWIAKDARDGTLVIRVAVDFTGEPVSWNINFSILPNPTDLEHSMG